MAVIITAIALVAAVAAPASADGPIIVQVPTNASTPTTAFGITSGQVAVVRFAGDDFYGSNCDPNPDPFSESGPDGCTDTGERCSASGGGCPDDDLSRRALLARVGSGPWKVVTRNTEGDLNLPLTGTGAVQFLFNDNSLEDNVGVIEVTVELLADSEVVGVSSVDTAPASLRPGLATISPDVFDVEAPLGTFDSPIASTPLRSSPLRSSPLRSSPLRSSPLRSSPLRSSPLRSSAFSQLTLASIPLRSSSWDEILAGTQLDGPPAAITLGQVLNANPPIAAVDQLTLADIALERSPLRSSSLGSFLLGGVPISRLPSPFDPNQTWCETFNTCADAGDLTLIDLEARGDSLSFFLAGMPLRGRGAAIAGSPLARTRISDIELARTPLAGRTFPAGTTVADVLDQIDVDISYGQLLDAYVATGDLPLADAGLPQLAERVPVRATDLVTVSSRIIVACPATGPVTIQVTLPDGARYAPDSARIAVGAGTSTPVTLLREGQTTYSFSATDVVSAGCGASSTPIELRLSLRAEPPARLGPARAQVDVFVGSVRATREGGTSTVDDVDDAGATAATAAALTAGQVRTGYIADGEDVDAYKLPALPAGTKVTVRLAGLPADYDLTVNGAPDGPAVAPLRSSPLRSSPLRSSSLDDDLDAQPDVRTPETLQDAPLRSSELADRPVRASSSNRGASSETVTYTVTDADAANPPTIKVTGYNGASSRDPYVLRATVTPPDTPPACRAARSLPTSPAKGTFPSLPLPASTQTIFLVNERRIAQLYPGADLATLKARLASVASQANVRGVVVPVESDPVRDTDAAYAAWDASPCSVEAANRTAVAVQGVLQRVATGLDDLRHVVVVGGDEVIPQFRVPDRTSLSNEREEAGSVVFGGKDTAISRALRLGNLLTDDGYGEVTPQASTGGATFVPDIALGRLVETPGEIIGQLDAYLGASGALSVDSAYVSGYDFLSDGAQAIDRELTPLVGSRSSRIDETWTSDDAAAGLNRAASGLTSINAHYDHYRALPARTFNLGGPDLLRASQANPAPNSLLFTAGCHAGLNLPDVGAPDATTGEQVRLRDWAQTLASKRAVYVANTTYGYGDTEAVAYTERLLELFSRYLATKRVTAGQALMYAKQRYAAETLTAGAYDVKSSQGLTFYGLPFYTMGTTGQVGPTAVEGPGATTPSGLAESPFSVTPNHQRQDTDRGTYFTADGEPPQVTHLRPIQPKKTLDVTPTDGRRVHGALVTELQLAAPVAIDPVVSRPTIDLGDAEPEIETLGTTFPASIDRTTRTADPTGFKDLLVLVTGQYDGSDGKQRLFSRVAGTVLRSTSSDYDPPRLAVTEGVVGDPAGESRTVTFRVRTPDTDVTRGLILYRTTDGPTTYASVTLTRVGTTDVWQGTATVPASVRVIPSFIAQLVDSAGNVGVATNKGPGFVGRTVAGGLAPRLVLSPSRPDSGIYRGPVDVKVDPRSSVGETFTISVDGGPEQPAEGGVQVTGDGTHRIVFTGSAGSTGSTTIRIDRTPPVVTGTVSPAPNADGIVTGVATIAWTCADPGSGVVRCPAASQLATETSGATVTSDPAEDVAGNTGTGQVRNLTVDLSAPTGTVSGMRLLSNGLILPILQLQLLPSRPLTGTAADTGAGIRSVTVRYTRTTGGTPVDRTATVTCTDATRRSCSWTATAPATGLWRVRVTITDRAGRTTAVDGDRVLVVL